METQEMGADQGGWPLTPIRNHLRTYLRPFSKTKLSMQIQKNLMNCSTVMVLLMSVLCLRMRREVALHLMVIWFVVSLDTYLLYIPTSRV
jgi:hypothetical protein